MTAPLAPGEKVVVASAALTAVLAGKTIRPAYHDEKLQVRYVRGVGLEWVGDAAVVVKTLSGPEYLWKSLNNEPESLWIIPGEPSKRGKWFSSSGTFVNVSDMTEGHLDNALSWLALKAAELKSEKRRREAKAKAVEAAKARDEKTKASAKKKREKYQARKEKYQASRPKTYRGLSEVLEAMQFGGKRLVPRGDEVFLTSAYYHTRDFGFVYGKKGDPKPWRCNAADLMSFARDLFVEVK